MRWPAAILVLLMQSAPVWAQKTAAESFQQAYDFFRSAKPAEAQRALEQTIDLAVQQKDVQVEAQARFYLGTALSRSAQYPASNQQFRTALELFMQLNDRQKQGEVYSWLGKNGYYTGESAESRANYGKAMAVFEGLGDWSEVAKAHYNLAFFTGGAEKLGHIQRGLELARKAGNRALEAVLLHIWADFEYDSDDFDLAFDRLSQARSILEELGDKESLAGVLTSIGRLYRVHGHPDQAFDLYRRARDLQKEVGDKPGVIQSLNAMGVALNAEGQSSEALRYEQEALRLARESGSSLLVKFMLEAIGSTQLHLGQTREAAAVLEEAHRMPPPRSDTLVLLSEARFRLHQYEAALQTADEALTAGLDATEITRGALENRAQALWKLGRTQEALADIRQVTDLVEQARNKLVPTDFMKQGFSDTDRKATNLSIHILTDAGEEREALETAERARGRAFLDLLATKNITPTPPLRTARLVLPARGSAALASSDDAIAVARRLNSTILSYWIDDTSTIIWAMSPDGRIAHARTTIGAATLDTWINEALRGPEKPAAHAPVQIASRGGETLLAGHSSQDAWRHLYDALIRPVRSSLPSKPGSRLTIIPSGPLFRVSFAALMDEKGRYLIENYSLNYSPAIEVFQYTYQAQQRTAALPARYLLVANPAGMAPADGKLLPALPGSEKEVQGISRLVPHDSTVLLEGKRADEISVRGAMPGSTVIHLATHGVIDGNDPLRSFLAFGKTSAQPGANGRLTAEEVYSLDLHANLVVLSACRTGLGRISGDGVAGLARAFFYAGAASVVSTLWDVADQPAAQLIEDFYRSFGKSGNAGKSEALREAQLHLMRSLRKGEVSVDTPFGTLPLPEDPVLWAGYILMGEPQ
jgi:CHAT domain-containing protein